MKRQIYLLFPIQTDSVLMGEKDCICRDFHSYRLFNSKKSNTIFYIFNFNIVIVSYFDIAVNLNIFYCPKNCNNICF